MLHKYKQNITFNIYKKVKSMKKNGWVIFPWGQFSIIVFWPPGHFSTRVNILSDTGCILRKMALFIISQDRQTQVQAGDAMATTIIID